METRKASLHQLEGGIIEDGLVREDDADGSEHVDGGPYQELLLGAWWWFRWDIGGTWLRLEFFVFGLGLGFDIALEERDGVFFGGRVGHHVMSSGVKLQLRIRGFGK